MKKYLVFFVLFLILGITSIKQQVISDIYLASIKFNVPYSVMYKIALIESNLNPLAKNKKTTSRGLFQIIEKTEYSLRKKCSIQGDIYNSSTNSELAACLIKINIQKTKLVDEFSIYILHFLGSYNGLKFLKAPPEAIGCKLFPKESKLNIGIFYKNGKPLTVLEISNILKTRLNKIKVIYPDVKLSSNSVELEDRWNQELI